MSAKHPALLGVGGVLLSLLELSNVIKIHAWLLHILPVELTGRSASKQVLPSFSFVLADRGYGAMQGGRSEEMFFQSVCQSCLNVGPQNDLDNELCCWLAEGYTVGTLRMSRLQYL